MKHFYAGIIFIVATILIMGCKETTYTPKPKGYFRIALPNKAYKALDRDCPFSFELPVYASTQKDPHNPNQDCWFDLAFNGLDANVYFSYKTIDNNLNKYLEDSRTLAFKHTIKANNIEQRLVLIPEKKVYGVVYDIKGDAASPYQFHLTDSVNHFLRASLYFNNIPNQDSTLPVLDFIKEDIDHLLETFEWKNL